MSQKKISILLVDDDQGIVDSLILYLEQSEFEVHTCMRGDEALEKFREIQPDALILDINLPGQDGLSILRDLRSESSVPVLMLSARDNQNNISTSFEFEADDYIGKPFSPKEVVMRIKAVLRRGTSQTGKEGLIYRDLRLVESDLKVIRGNKEALLTKSEFQLLKYIIAHEGKVVSREDLMKEIMGYANFLYDRTIDTHIKNIRHKIGDDIILTVRGVGYKSF
ncbi:response regulator transcription factor [Candidatus Gracilibacteria bacterium]|nr:response regulator transcription factor [Candidatus Gracilibacteria bacterium]